MFKIIPPLESEKIRTWARGKPCTIRIPEVCLFSRRADTETSVWAHPPTGGGKGMAQKGNDLLGAVACHACHDVLDGRASVWFIKTLAHRKEYHSAGHFQSLIWLWEDGIIEVTS